MNTAVTRNDWVGRVIDGRFPLLEWLGNTEQAGVFRTELKGPQPTRAVIRLLPAEPELAEARLQLWKQAAAFNHPHLMRVLESGRAQVGGVELLYVVTEYADESLAQVIPDRPLSIAEAREMLGPILDALGYLHGRGMVHGHIKPSNVMVVRDQIKLPTERIQSAGSTAKTQRKLQIYDAPEIASGGLMPSSDIWSLGVTLVEALTQHPPQLPQPAGRDPIVPAEIAAPFAEIARGCLRYDASRRVSLRDLKAMLNPAVSIVEPANEIDQLAPADVQAHPYDSRPSFSKRTAAIISGIAILIAVLVFALMRSHRDTSSASTPQASTPAASPAPATPAPRKVQPSATGTINGEVAERVMPDVSASANRTIRGKVDVTVRVDVDASGAVQNARLDSLGHSRYFNTRALDASRKWRFNPPKRDGNAVPSVWALRYRFRRSGPEVNAVQVSP